MPISTPDPEGVAAERLGRGEPDEGSPSPRKGRPKGSTPWNKGKRYKQTGRGAEPVSDAPKAPRTPEEIEQGAAVCTFLTATLWDIAAPLAKRRSLTDDEARRLGAALDPVLDKYLPSLAGWQLEINLLIVVAGLWQATALTKPEPTPDTNRLEIVQ